METYRLAQLGLPAHIMTIAKSLNPPSQRDLQQVAALFHQYREKWELIRRLLQSEAQIQSPILDGLRQAETTAPLRMQVCLNIRAAWRRLPLEIWDRIFAYYLVATRSGVLQRGFDGTNKMAMFAPSSLSLVSKFWNAIVLATPSIWKDVTILADNPSAKCSSPVVPIGEVERILNRLNRVSATPYRSSLTISAPGPLNPRYSESLIQHQSVGVARDGIPIHVLLQCHQIVHAVERLCIFMPPDYQQRYNGCLGSLTFPSTYSLVVVGFGLLTGPGATVRFPAVKTAVMANTIDIYEGVPSSFPWAQLTNLLLGDRIRLETMYSVLSMCTSLVKGSFWFEEGLGERTPPATPTTLHSLAELSLICDQEDKFIGDHENTGHSFIPCTRLSFPALSQLRVYSDNISVATFSSLTRLVAMGIRSPYSLEAILTGCPLLVELIASRSCEYAVEESLDPLIYNSGQPKGSLLQIVALVCTVSYPFRFDDIAQSLRNIISSRASNDNQAGTSTTRPAFLKRFVIRFQAEFPLYIRRADIEAQVDPSIRGLRTALQPLVTDGLDFSCELLSEASCSYWPQLDRDHIKHWEDGMMDILDESWEYTTSAGPPSNRPIPV